MEPANQRRDDSVPVPPGKLAGVPQWSPPLGGGTTSAGEDGGVLVGEAAMEPADQRQDDRRTASRSGLIALPQWSPPRRAA